jgi:hypothetical protein
MEKEIFDKAKKLFGDLKTVTDEYDEFKKKFPSATSVYIRNPNSDRKFFVGYRASKVIIAMADHELRQRIVNIQAQIDAL